MLSEIYTHQRLQCVTIIMGKHKNPHVQSRHCIVVANSIIHSAPAAWLHILIQIRELNTRNKFKQTLKN